MLTAGTVIQGRLTDGNEIEFTIKKDTPLSSDRFSFTEVEINIAAATFAQGNAEFRQFKGVVKSENIFISLLHDPDVPAYQLPLAQDKQGLNPFDPAVQANPANFDAARVHAEMTLFDDDVPGIRIVRLGDDTSIGEGNTAAYGVSLISEPSAPVTVVLTPNREIALSSNVAGSLGNGSFSPVFDYQLDATDVPTDLDLRLDSLLRTDQGWTATFDARLRNVVFDGSDVDLTLSAESAGTSAAVSFDVPGDGETDAAGRPLMGNWNQFQRLTVTHLTERFDASGAFFQLSLNLDGVSRDIRIDVVKDVDFAAQTVSLTFDSSNWADLQPLTVRAVPDAHGRAG